MPKISRNKMQPEVEGAIIGQLFSYIKNLKTNEDVSSFFHDVFTPTERKIIAKRIAIAVLLQEGFTYKNISKHLKVSEPTINKVHTTLKEDGRAYEKIVVKVIEKRKKMRNSSGSGIDELVDFIEKMPKISGPRWRWLYDK